MAQLEQWTRDRLQWAQNPRSLRQVSLCELLVFKQKKGCGEICDLGKLIGWQVKNNYDREASCLSSGWANLIITKY